MKVKELMEFLSSVDPNSEVIMSGDSEGNNYSPLSNVELAIYKPLNSWRGEVFTLEYGAEDHCLEEDEWQEMLDTLPRSIVLWPVN